MNRLITTSLIPLLEQLGDVLSRLSDVQYISKIPVLSEASLGMHVRHIIEFFQELEQGYLVGCVDYDARRREKAIENHLDCAILKLRQIIADLKYDNKTLLLAYKPSSGTPNFHVQTSYERELLYNLEHTVHHMAILKIGIRAISNIELAEDFGVASSTIRYHQDKCVQ
ncbi:hypothetical protein [Dyadobacter fanqingshengii]|uniref:DinB family protein n=1 Tax=Dyadobacter fanqingshengii TaxID=2906443 RepID=A0A9X1THV9_9BACT|nr:hypothetical protein [Dyadobacter fanqingshengii]MCF0042142.1 hypothetical protein [Dyadobacter fanqingshengii]USJ35324.1 hypothetical protein NFI81_21855 [Dyadobacter fanqingshengii]